jgi:hypothetical protein
MSTLRMSAPDVNKLLKRFVDGLSFEDGDLEYKGAGVKISASRLHFQAEVRIEAGGLRVNAHTLAVDPNGAAVDFDLG